MRTYQLLDVILDLFDGGAAAGGDGAGSAATGEGSAGAGENQQNGPSVAATDKSGENDSAAASAAGEQKDTRTLAERRAAYKALIEGEYKDLYTEDTTRIVSKRLGDAKAVQARLAAAQPVLDTLALRYGVTDGDMTKLAAALDADDALWTDLAEKAGMDVPKYKEFLRMEQENAAFRAEHERAQNQAAYERQLAAWAREAEQLSAEYPEFDLNEATEDEEFIRMLRAHVPMKTAYEVRNLSRIKAQTAAEAAKTAEKQVTDNVKARGSRPVENGTGDSSGFVAKVNISMSTKEEREELSRRAARGEKISL